MLVLEMNMIRAGKISRPLRNRAVIVRIGGGKEGDGVQGGRSGLRSEKREGWVD